MGLNLDEIRKKHEQLLNSQGGGNSFSENFLKVDKGTTPVRILPPKDSDEDSFYAETKIHRIPEDVNDSKSQIKNYHCPKLKGESCPICDLYYTLWKTGVKDDETVARKIKPNARYYMNVLDRNNADAVKIFSTGVTVFKKIIATIVDEDYGDITDLNEGFDFKIVKTQEAGDPWPKYDQSQARPKSSKVKNQDEVMDNLHDVSALISYSDYDVLRKAADEVAAQTSLNHSLETPEGEVASDEDYESRLRGE